MVQKTLNTDTLTQWIGRQESAHDTIDARPAKLMKTIVATNSGFEDGDILPPLWHWLYFPTEVALSGLGSDGHPKLGGFLPPVDLPRRMWAGGRLVFHKDITIGDRLEKRSVIKDVTLKEGRSGKLCFVTVQHKFCVGEDLRLTEEHDIVYREDAAQGSTPPPPPHAPNGAEFSAQVVPSVPMLFRYSAVTFNTHRIHYDRDYCKDAEGYPGLVFHGPLTATLLADLAVRQSGRQIRTFDFKAISPLFDTSPFQIMGKADGNGQQLWAANPEGHLAMKAKVGFR